MKIDGNISKFYQYSFPMQTVLVTCNNEKRETNIITIAWHTPISKIPPLYAVSVAPSRYSHDLIKNNKEFVINFVHFDMIENAHFCGTHSGRSTDKIDKTKLTLVPSKTIKVPYIKECFAHLECKLVKNYTIGDHTLFIGEVVTVYADKHAFENDLLQINKI